MQKNYHRRFPFVTILIVFVFIPGCQKLNSGSGETGFLKGTISIGPLCPVQSEPPDPACLPSANTYKAYPVGVWTSDGKKKVGQIDPELNGSYSIELLTGNYLVVLENNQIKIGSSNLPVMISIISNLNTFLNISIDTGIR